MSKLFVDSEFTAKQSLEKMLNLEPDLYEQCLGTAGFAYHFNQLANKAVKYDALKEVTDIRRENSEREIGRMNNLLYEANRSRDALKESCDELVELIRQATDGQTRSMVTPWRARAIEALASHEKRMKGFK